MATAGSIPEKLVVVLKNSCKHKWQGGEFVAPDAYVTDAKSKTALETARNWAVRTYGYQTAPDANTTSPAIVEIDNEPFNTLRIVGMEERGEGGRAWKVITPQGWIVDLREDVFMEALFGHRITNTAGLEIKGPFRWVVNGSQMRLALVDSSLYRDIAKLDAIKKLPQAGKIPAASLVVGGLYTSLGWKDRRYNRSRYSVFLGHVRHKGKKAFAWYECYASHPITNADIISVQQEINRWATGHITITGALSCTEFAGTIIVPPQKPAKIYNGYGDTVDVGDLDWL